MTPGQVEHVNVTVTNPTKTAQLLCDVFGWKIRWEGPSALGGFTVHVGAEDSYLAVYSPDGDDDQSIVKESAKQGLNHVGVVVDDLEDVEKRVKNAGLKPFSYGDYEPGRRFYFLDYDGIEYEVVSYS